ALDFDDDAELVALACTAEHHVVGVQVAYLDIGQRLGVGHDFAVFGNGEAEDLACEFDGEPGFRSTELQWSVVDVRGHTIEATNRPDGGQTRNLCHFLVRDGVHLRRGGCVAEVNPVAPLGKGLHCVSVGGGGLGDVLAAGGEAEGGVGHAPG
ncbi:hypothetical protein ADL26_11315, partial [Thermoactinomyces vulgaris]